MLDEISIDVASHVDSIIPTVSIVYYNKKDNRKLSTNYRDLGLRPEISLCLPPLGEEFVEAWSFFTKKNQVHLIDKNIFFLKNEKFCFIQGFSKVFDTPSKQTFELYNHLLLKAKEEGFYHLQRIWNYVPRINHGEKDQEVYRQFCLGRYKSFHEQNYIDKDFSAASAVGTDDNKLCVVLLMAKEKGLHFESPQQQSAFSYPREYGPKSPSFARATFSNPFNLLFVSGTASILGHQSMFIGKVRAQTKQTIKNIQVLIESISMKMKQNFTPIFYKVYIRYVDDFSIIKECLLEFIGKTPSLFLRSDICRKDLLVEVEAVYQPI